MTILDSVHVEAYGSRLPLNQVAGLSVPDIVLVDLKNVYMQPARDPLRSLVYTAADRAVRDVFVDGIQVVKSGQVLTLDHADALARLTEAQARMEKDVPNRDGLGRSSLEISPLSLPLLAQ